MPCARSCLPVGVCVVRKLPPCPGYSRRRVRINSGFLCSLDGGCKKKNMFSNKQIFRGEGWARTSFCLRGGHGSAL